MAKRIRRFTITTPVVTGARNLSWSVDGRHQIDFSRADDEAVGDPVDMGGGPVTVNFELLAYLATVITGYCASLVCVFKEITYSAGAESSANKTVTFSDGFLKVGGDVPSENPGSLPVTGEFKNVAIT